MALHQTLKNCTQCGHAVELYIEVCPKCKKVFEESQAQLPDSGEPIDASLSPAEILAKMQEKNSVKEAHSEHVQERTMSQAQNAALSKEKEEFNRRFKDLFGKK